MRDRERSEIKVRLHSYYSTPSSLRHLFLPVANPLSSIPLVPLTSLLSTLQDSGQALPRSLQSSIARKRQGVTYIVNELDPLNSVVLGVGSEEDDAIIPLSQ